jgi:hypothetical protein
MSNIKTAVILKGSRALLQGQKFAPELMTVVGIAGTVTAAVLAARATLKLQPILDETAEDVENIKAEYAHGDTDHSEYKKYLSKAYFTGGVKVAKLYAVPVGVGALSIAATAGGASIQHKRVVGLAAAYKGLDASFNEYRKNVIAEHGEEKDAEYRLGLRAVDEAEKDSEDGSDVPAVLDDEVFGSPYARVFGEMNENWVKEPGFNLMFLRQKQDYLNNRLHARGHLFLNEVYEALGFEHSKAGAVTGWVLGSNGDNIVDFGIYTGGARTENFVNGNENSVLLDFNVDGVIFDKIEKRRK